MDISIFMKNNYKKVNKKDKTPPQVLESFSKKKKEPEREYELEVVEDTTELMHIRIHRGGGSVHMACAGESQAGSQC